MSLPIKHNMDTVLLPPFAWWNLWQTNKNVLTRNSITGCNNIFI
jgi:hypothetical protein